jgi:hypothetical protein
MPTAAQTTDDLITRLQSTQATLPAGDGVSWFNHLYLDATVAIREYRWAQAPPF